MLTVIRVFLLGVGSISGLMGLWILVTGFRALIDVGDQPTPEEVTAHVEAATWGIMFASPILWALLILSSLCFGSLGVIEAVLLTGRQIRKTLVYSSPAVADPPLITTTRRPTPHPQPNPNKKRMSAITRLIG